MLKEEGELNAEDMICKLVEGQEAVVRTARTVFPIAAMSRQQTC
jgi:starvation-inducible DNA-binding protein